MFYHHAVCLYIVILYVILILYLNIRDSVNVLAKKMTLVIEHAQCTHAVFHKAL